MPDDLFKKLDQVLAEDKTAKDAAPARSQVDEESDAQDSPRVRIQKAREQIVNLTRGMVGYVEDEIVPRYPGLFKARILTHHQTQDAPVFGRAKGSAEHGIVEIVLKGSHVLAVRFSAVILSREIEVETAHYAHGQEAKAVRKTWDLSGHLVQGKVQWLKAFESIVLQFVEWYGGQGK